MSDQEFSTQSEQLVSLVNAVEDVKKRLEDGVDVKDATDAIKILEGAVEDKEVKEALVSAGSLVEATAERAKDGLSLKDVVDTIAQAEKVVEEVSQIKGCGCLGGWLQKKKPVVSSHN